MSPSRLLTPTVFAPLAFGLLVWTMLPAGVTALNDDFGYYRSVIETLQHGRPWTDDWLEPWAASLSGLSAILYLLTHSFTAATYGLLAICAAVSFASATALVRTRGQSACAAIALATVLLTFPTLLWKEIEFTSVALYVPCLLLAIFLAERRAWGWFLVPWALAIASRQSAVCWGVLPAAEFFRETATPGTARLRRLKAGLTIAAAALLFFALRAAMNTSHAQRVLTTHVGEHIDWPAAERVLALGFGIGAIALGLGAALVGGGAGRTVHPLRRYAGLAAFAGALALLWTGRSAIAVEHPLFQLPIFAVYLALLLIAALAGWLRGQCPIAWELVATAVASVALVSVRAAGWDYYFIDAGLLCLFAVRAPTAPVPHRRIPRATLGLGLGLSLAASLCFAFELKADVDRKHAVAELAERALRDGRLVPAELSFAPFGLTAWHFFPYYIAHEGRDSGDLAGFGGYLRPGAIEVGQGYSKWLHVLPQFRHEPPADRHNLVAWSRSRFLGAFRAEYYLLRFKTAAEAPPAMPLNEASFHDRRFPLTDAEWTALIAARNP